MKKYLLLIICSLVVISFTIYSKNDKKGNKKPQKVTAGKSYTFLDINNIATYFYNNGWSDNSPNGNSGFVYPKGTGKTAVYKSGFLWGAKVTGDTVPRVGGSTYRTGLQPGIIQADGTPADPTSDKYRIYRVRRDVYPGGFFVDLTSEASNEKTTASALRADYEKDWSEWPADLGAPFDDKNNNGIYEPSIDVPGFPGADQTIWFVANDLDTAQVKSLYGANPLGIEIQATVWAYNRPGAVGNMLFRKYKLINKTGTGILPPVTFDSMYVSMWSDVDLGEAGDDFVGTDSTLSLVYTYNSNERDAVYYPLPPPAIGFNILEGPLVDGIAGEDRNNNGIDDAVDFGIYNGQKVGPGKINLPMTTGYAVIKSTPGYGDPISGNIKGSKEFYNYFKGLWGPTGAPFVNPNTGEASKFIYNGDPQTGTGWIEGLPYPSGFPAGDRRMGSAAGPFTMKPGDSKEIVIAEIIGGALPGSDRLSAIGILKANSMTAKYLYDINFESLNPPREPQVKAVELDKKIILDWGEDASITNEIESFSKGGYTFQGYNVYQLPSPTSALSEAKRIATFDKIDNVGKILDRYYDPIAGAFLQRIAQYGSDSGIKRSFTITVDSLHFDSNGKGLALINGIKYYFAVTAYSYNQSNLVIPNNYESKIKVITVTPHIPDPGITKDEPGKVSLTKSGPGTANANVKIVNPDLLTGHNYEIFFNDQDYVNDAEGKWHKVTTSTKRDGKNKYEPADISPSTIAVSAVFGTVGGTLELKATLNLSSPDFDYADGVKLDFPAGVAINSADGVRSAVRGDFLPAKIVGQSILWGDSSRSTFGAFSGGENFIINVSGEIPFDINYTIYDDAYGDLYAGTALGIKDARGTLSITSVGSKRVTQHQWGVKDVTTGKNVLENQTVFGGKDWYFGKGPGGSSPAVLGGNLGPDYSATVDGLQISIDDLTFDSPVTYSSAKQTEFGFYGSTYLKLWGDATFFGNATGLTPFGDYSGATHEDLIQDLELRFTGVPQDLNNPQESVIQSGGQMATIYNRAKDEALATTIRAPFELWEVERNRQINYWLVSRNADGNAPWDDVTGIPKWYRMSGRDYIIPYPTDYNGNPTPAEVGQTGNHSTWLLFFKQDGDSKWSTGDKFLITYANNVIPGKDKFEFSTNAKQFNAEKAKNDVEKINVFPNPYYAKSTDDLNSYDRFVTFTHLPVKAKIRIFNLGGNLIRVIDKDDNSQYVKWDLLTSHGFLAASGIYIAYIEMPDLGTIKILKLAVVQGIPINNFSK